MKLRTAVILAARQEKDSDIPYPLCPIDGNNCLLDHTLEILNSIGYEKIYIIAGYQAALFDRYKSTNIQIIHNKEFQTHASMGSLSCVAPYIQEDFLLIEGDTFYERIVIDRLTSIEEGNCLAITEESGSGDEAFVETQSGYITKLSKDKHQICQFDGELIGILRLSYSTFKKMLEKWGESNNAFLNYEYLLMDVTHVLERACLRFSNLIWGDVDTKTDYHKLCNYIYPKLKRRDNPFDRANLLEHLATILPNEQIENCTITPLGGMSNKNFKIVTASQRSYVLRVPGIASGNFVQYTNEEINSLLACKIGITPNIYYLNSQTGIKLADFIEQAETLTAASIQHKKNILQIAKILKSFHKSSVRLANDFNVFSELDRYASLLTTKEHKELYAQLKPQIRTYQNTLNELGVTLHPCHNDLVAENFIKSADIIYLIDWEYSGMNDPHWDIAALFLESTFTEENQILFLYHYFDSEIPKSAQQKILIYQILMDILWTLWTWIKESQGDNFGTYAADRWERGLQNMKFYFTHYASNND